MTRLPLILVTVLCSCATLPVASEPAATTVITLAEIVGPAATVHVSARVTPPTVAVDEPPVPTLPAFDCATVRYIVNQLPFEVLNPEPVRTAYRMIAEVCRGWTLETIARWETFAVDDVPIGESVGCPLVRGGAQVQGMCDIVRQGTREDTGAYQLTRPFYEYPHGIICASDGYCSSESIVASPFDSINAGLAAIESQGRKPWCFADWAIDLHWSCPSTPKAWSNL